MRGRRSSRSAAVVLAGCVGLAVFAPGLALAAELPGVTQEECTPGVGTWDTVNEVCEELATESDANTGCTGSGSGSSSGSSDAGSGDAETSAATPTVPDVTPDVTPDVPDVTPTVPDATPTVPEQSNPDLSDVVDPNAVDPNAENSSENEAPEDTTTDEQAPTPKADVVEDAVPDLQKEIDKIVPDAGANPITLPGLPVDIPQPVDGKFKNVNDACLNAISKLEFPAGTTGLENLSGQLQGFCHGLNTTDVRVCLDHLRDVIKHLCPTVIEYNTTINFNTTYVSNEWWGAYWTHRYDVDCDEVTYDEANAILDWDRSDPFRLDRDDDGEACERNAHEHEVDYASYPEGGVSTGDGSTGSGASAVEIALAAGAVSGLGATGLVLARRYAKQG